MTFIKSIEISGWRCIPCTKPLILKNLGKIIVIIGDNASGKSTLAHALYIIARLVYAKNNSNETNEPKKLILKLLEKIYGFQEIKLMQKIFYRGISREGKEDSCDNLHTIIRTDKGAVTLNMKKIENDIEVYEPSGFDSLPELWDYVTAKFPLYFYNIVDIEYFIENIEHYSKESKAVINEDNYFITILYKPKYLIAKDPIIGDVPLRAMPAGSYSFSILRRIIKLVTEKDKIKSPFILLEEPEMGLNPLKQLWSNTNDESTLYGLFKKLINEKNDFTLVITTQSPYVISTIAKLIEDPNVEIKEDEVSIISSCVKHKYEDFNYRHCRYQKFKYNRELETFLPVDDNDAPIDNPICESTFAEAAKRVFFG